MWLDKSINHNLEFVGQWQSLKTEEVASPGIAFFEGFMKLTIKDEGCARGRG